MKKRLLSIALVVVMLVGGTLTASATTMNQAQAGLSSANQKIQEIEAEKAALEAEMESLDAELVALLTDIEIIEDEITAKHAELQQAQVELQAAQEKQQQQYDAMKKRIVYMYENSSVSIIEALLEADSFTDMINKVSYFNEVYTYDRKLLGEYEATVVEVENLVAQITEDEAMLRGNKETLVEQQNQLETKIASKESTVDNFDKELADAKALATRYKNTINELNAAAQNNSSSSSSSSGSSSSGKPSSSGSSGNTVTSTGSKNGQAVVNYACQFVGNRYVWGGNSLTNGVDCSGFVQQVYLHFGVSLPRTSYTQRSVGRAVSVSEMQPGDIVCYSGHVAIYIGNGQIVHASNPDPYPAGGIKYGSAYHKTIITVRRVFD